MIPFLRSFRLDETSFWLGFFASALLWWVLARLRPYLAELREKAKERAQAARKELQAGTQMRLGSDMLRLAQRQHLAAPLFSLDEVLIPPSLLAPSLSLTEDTPLYAEDITDGVLPYLPDWPEMAAAYHAPTLSLVQALQGGAPIAMVGPAGSGKTVALAHLAIQVIRHAPETGLLAECVPLLVHAADLVLPPRKPEDPGDTLIAAVASRASALTLPRLTTFLKSSLAGENVLLLLDGLDELPPEQSAETVAYLEALLGQYPALRVAAAVDLSGAPGLTGLGFTPLALLPWRTEQRTAFIDRWSQVWEKFVAPPGEASSTDSLLITGWLANDPNPLTPLELTLKTWAAFAGDALGDGPLQAIEAYLRRMTTQEPKSRQALKKVALQSVLTHKPVMARKEAESWVVEFEVPAAPDSPAEAEKGGRSLSRVLSALVETDLVRTHPEGRLSLVHPVLVGYLAAEALVDSNMAAEEMEALLCQPTWSGKAAVQQYLAAADPDANWIVPALKEPVEDFLLSSLFEAARWLPVAPETARWKPVVMRKLVAVLQKENMSLALRSRALAALAGSHGAGIEVLLRQMLSSADPHLRQLAALGSGLLRDSKAVSDLTLLLADRSPHARRAALLALVAIGDRHALETVATALLQGDDALRRSAAEALANHPEEGHPTLEEAAGVEEIGIRHAAVYGLRRIQQPWAQAVLEKLLVDQQWIVQNAASQVMEGLNQPNPRIPQRAPVLTEAPWLIEYAAQNGMGVAPGKPALDLLYRLLKDGSEEQRLEAIAFLAESGDQSAVLPLYQLYFACQDDQREAAYHALWRLGLSQIELPPPVQYGYKI